MVDESGNFVRGPDAGNQEKKRSVFNATDLKGRPFI